MHQRNTLFFLKEKIGEKGDQKLTAKFAEEREEHEKKESILRIAFM